MPIVILMVIAAALHGNLPGLIMAVGAGIYAKAYLADNMRDVRVNVRQDQDARLAAYVSGAKTDLRKARATGDADAVSFAEVRLASAEARAARITDALDSDEREFAAGDNTAAAFLGVATFACPVFALACLADSIMGAPKKV